MNTNLFVCRSEYKYMYMHTRLEVCTYVYAGQVYLWVRCTCGLGVDVGQV